MTLEMTGAPQGTERSPCNTASAVMAGASVFGLYVACISRKRKTKMTRKSRRLVASAGFAGLLYGASPASAQAVAPDLGTERTYGVTSSTFVNTAAGTTINGTVGQPALCYSAAGAPASPAAVTGTTVVPCPAQVGLDQTGALATANGQACTSLGAIVALDNSPGHPTGVYGPGCYSSTGAMNVTLGTTVTLSGAGVYVFRSTGALNTGANSNVVLAGGACASDVTFAPVGATTLGATSAFVGSILDAAGITLGQNSSIVGRALAFGGTVTVPLTPVTITVPTCAAFVPGGGPVPPTVTKAFSPASIAPGGVSSLTITLANANASAIALTAALTDTLPGGVLIAAVPNAVTTCGGAVSAPAGGSTVSLATSSAIPSGSCTIAVNVTAAAVGTYFNTISAGALQTSSGINALPATAPLAVLPPAPTPRPNACAATAPDLFIVKRHTDVFVVGANATYSIGLFNNGVTSSGAITVTDTLPAGLTFVSAIGASWTCAAAGQVVTCTTSASIPGNITLTVTPNAGAAPSVTNTAVVTGGGDCDVTNNATADATLVALAVPTLPEWAIIMLSVLLAIVGVIALRRRAAL